MNRYQDNTSPEPNVGLNLNECYKTPNLQYNSVYNINQLYPTPPSETETSPLNVCKTTPDGLVTPTLNYYEHNSFNNESHDGSLYRNKSACQEEQVYSKQNEGSSQQQVSSRFKRRSRTTYTKAQLDALEATFEKTHYPEIRVVDDLSSMLNLSTERISIWFQNRRARFKKARKLETKENKLSMENSAQFSSYPVTTGYQNPLNQYPQSVPKAENFPLNRNLFNSFPLQDKPNVPLTPFANSPQLNYYNQIPSLSTSSLPSSHPFYSTQISPTNIGYYQPNYQMMHPSYQNSGL